MLKKLVSYLELNIRFKSGIIALGMVLCLLLALLFFVKQQDAPRSKFVENSQYQKVIDSLKLIAALEKAKRDSLYASRPFNPNVISDYTGYKLGMSPAELDRLFAFRESGKWIRSKEEFQAITKVSDSLLAAIAPRFKFPQFKSKQAKNTYPKKVLLKEKPFDQKKDLNTVSPEELTATLNLPDFIAQRIVAYRKKIGGFQSELQLKDIYGLYAKQREQINLFYAVKTKPKIDIISIYEATIPQLVAVPYIDFELALAIKDYLGKNKTIDNFYEFSKIEGFPSDKIDRIALYLKI